MSSLFDTTRNYSFYAIPIAWVLAISPHTYAITLSKTFDNRSPRTYTATLEKDQTIDNATRDRITRAEGAQSNGFENLSLFASAIVAGNLAGLSAKSLNLLAGGYLLTRAVYNYIYIHNTTERTANLRSLTYMIGVGHCMALFVGAGMR